MRSGPIEQPSLYDARFEHEACGVGFVAHIDGRRSHELVEQGRELLEAMDHRGARGADPDTGDGAGMMLQLPDRFLRTAFRAEADIALPAEGDYAVAMIFLPRDPALQMRCEELCVRVAQEEGQRPLGWRDVPVRPDAIGRVARETEPLVRQLAIARGPGVTAAAFRRKLYVIRRRVELGAAARRIPEATFTIGSLSSTTLTYKGLLTAGQLTAYYPELRDPAVESAIALVHSRFSTNTLGSWDLAQPFGFLAHNGEINTVRGNRAWLHAREPLLRSQLLGDDLQKLYPIIDERWSDSAALDAVFELLVMAGRSPAHALTMLIPPATHDDMPDDVRAFVDFHSALTEPWEGPAAVAFCDGRRVGAVLDRAGLRPARWWTTRQGLIVLASEAGALALDPRDVIASERLEPGTMLMVDTESGRVLRDPELKAELACKRPFRALLDEGDVRLGDVPRRAAHPAPTADELARRQGVFGYTQEELRLVLTPMASGSYEPVSSMGLDTPLAILSERPQLLSSFFKQHFAQVTNPPVDPQREALVMSLKTQIGAQGDLLDETQGAPRRVVLDDPILRMGDLERLRALGDRRLRCATLDCLYDVESGERGLERTLDALCRSASRVVGDGVAIVILSDRGATERLVPVPILLATAAVHSHLVREGSRTRCSVVVESGEPREVMHLALLVGYGAAAVNPYLALDSVSALAAEGRLGDVTVEEARCRYVAALNAGMLKVLSRMGIATVQAYRGAALFEAVGLGEDVIARYFTGTISRVGGVGLAEIARDVAARAAAASSPAAELERGGQHEFRRDGERHVWEPDAIVHLQRAARDASVERYRAFAAANDDPRAHPFALRSLLDLRPSVTEVAASEVEPLAAVLARFATGAMSLGALSTEAHETLAIAMNRIGGRSNSGEGGEDARRSRRDANGDLRGSAIKQVASARFGVTTAYLLDADQIQIKIAQGAKPGEGGQLPADKVDETIARLRHATPGVGLISPPPHHDIYSIEDLAQLIHDLRCVNADAEISVKLVAQAGIGTIAAGVAKAGADHIVIAGHDGGTGASPLSSVRSVGLPWELGLAEAHQVLVRNELRSRVRLQVDGGMRTGRDVVVAALLGADEFAFSTAPLVVLGCVMMRACHLNTCPVGIATQDPELRRRFAGTPEQVIRYLGFVAEDVRELVATLGARGLDEVVGRSDLLVERANRPGIRLDLRPLLEPAPGGSSGRRRRRPRPTTGLEMSLLPALRRALEGLERVELRHDARTSDRALGAHISAEIVRRHGAAGLPPGTITLRLAGAAGQSLGAWCVPGLAIVLEGQANDYVAKGLSGGSVAIRPPPGCGYPDGSVVAGNTVLYGATSGELYVRGRAGDRFAVRNSGAEAVVEGVGDHGCEYMTGGRVVVLGPIGRNFGAGMTGGVAYIHDPFGLARRRCNEATVAVEQVDDADELHRLLRQHLAATGSPLAGALLADWPTACDAFVQLMPHDVRALIVRERELEACA